MNSSSTIPSPLTWPQTLIAMVIAVAAFHLANAWSAAAWLMVVYLGALTCLTGAKANRRAFYTGFFTGLLVFVPQMGFLWTIFGVVAIPLWMVLAFWIGLFVALGRVARVRLGERWGHTLLPVLWLGLEYFRSELYYLRFAWFNAGFAFWEWPGVVGGLGGVYGVGFILMSLAVLWLVPGWNFRQRTKLSLVAVAIIGWAVGLFPALASAYSGPPPRTVKVAGVQHEFPNEPEVLSTLDKLIAKNPDAELLVLSEYTFDGPVPPRVLAWCRDHRRHLIAGGKEELPDRKYYNTAFVVDPNGEVVFKQGKCTPIQFFNDGLPALTQRVWDSPWGKLGICICYDLSFTRVTDELIRLGAQAIIVPTMDVAEWGGYQHQLHYRIAPLRAAEYHVPIFRVASSGISQIVNKYGAVTAAASFPGAGDQIAGQLIFRNPRSAPAHAPVDRALGLAAALVTGALILWFTVVTVRQNFAKLKRHRLPG